MKKIASDKAPEALGFYSQAIEHNGLCFSSMQIGISPENGELKASFQEQMIQVMDNLGNILKSGELDWECVFRMTVYLADMKDFGEMNEIYGRYLSNPYPAREVIAVAGLPKNAKVGISFIASR